MSGTSNFRHPDLESQQRERERREVWEMKVCAQLEKIGEMNTSDAQAFMQANEEKVNDYWFFRNGEEYTAYMLLRINPFTKQPFKYENF